MVHSGLAGSAEGWGVTSPRRWGLPDSFPFSKRTSCLDLGLVLSPRDGCLGGSDQVPLEAEGDGQGSIHDRSADFLRNGLVGD